MDRKNRWNSKQILVKETAIKGKSSQTTIHTIEKLRDQEEKV